jgi:dCMP deaminase
MIRQDRLAGAAGAASMQQNELTYADPAKQERYDQAYMRMAAEWATLSHCTRKKVGALLVRDGMIISDGYNGTPTGFPNDCEDAQGMTLWYVLHAEANAIMKVARSTNNASGATLYLTLSPCRECSKLILQAGIRRLVYLDEYKDASGLEILLRGGVLVRRLSTAITK